MTAIARPLPRSTSSGAPGAGVVATTAAVAQRTVRKFLRTPQLIGLALVQSSMFLLLFRYVFGGALGVGDVSYVDFLVPGFVAGNGVFFATGTAAGMAEDVEQGFFDRLRSLPIPRVGVLAGRALADTVLASLTLAATTAAGVAVGFRLHAGVPSALAAFGLCVLAAFAFDWLFIVLGLVAGNAQAAQGMSMLVFPLTFVSSTYVPVESMPGWMQAFAAHQPMTPLIDAVRALAIGNATGAAAGPPLAATLLWLVAIVAVAAPLAALLFGRDAR